MKNDDHMILRVTRHEVLEYITAVQHIIFDFEDEVRDDTLTEERRRIAQTAIDWRWQPVLDHLRSIFDTQDKLEESL